MTLTAAEIRRRLREDPGAYIRSACDGLLEQVGRAAELIRGNRHNSPVVLLSGPTASGKTTTAKLIARELLRWGIGTHVLSLDDYFLDVAPGLTPLNDRGEYDFESPYCLDLPLLGEHFELLARGQAIEVPSFDFPAQCRRPGPGRRVQPREDEVVLFEGIHALGPQLAERHGGACRLFVNVCRDIVEESGEMWLSATHQRLLRRVVRDYRTRGASPAYTLELWENVRAFEKTALLSYGEGADLVIDTTMGYEPWALRPLALPLLEQVTPADNRWEEACRIRRRLEEAEPVADALVPEDALTREFMGGGLWG